MVIETTREEALFGTWVIFDLKAASQRVTSIRRLPKTWSEVDGSWALALKLWPVCSIRETRGFPIGGKLRARDRDVVFRREESQDVSKWLEGKQILGLVQVCGACEVVSCRANERGFHVLEEKFIPGSPKTPTCV